MGTHAHIYTYTRPHKYAKAYIYYYVKDLFWSSQDEIDFTNGYMSRDIRGIYVR